MKYLFVLSLLLTGFPESCQSQDISTQPSSPRPNINKERSDSLAQFVPPAKGFINDYVQLFSGGQILALDSIVSGFEKETTIEIGVGIIDSTMVKADDFEDYTLVMLRVWGVGKKGKNNGILIVISPHLRRMRIQNGTGIENVLSDDETRYIIENFFILGFRQDKYFEGTRDGIIAIINKLRQDGL